MENKELIQLKKDVSNRLKEIDVDSFNLDSTDKRLTIYVKSCIKNPDKHNLYELLSIERFFAFLKKYEYRSGEVRGFITLFERLKFSGTNGATNITASPVQVFQFANIKGFYREDGRRLTNYVYFSFHEFGKTTETVSFMVDDLLFGDANSQCYAGANSYNRGADIIQRIKERPKRLDRET